MNEKVEQVEGEVLDTMPTAQQQASTALATTENPYMRMAEMAMSTGKVDQLDRLLDLQIKWDTEQARRAFVAAMSDFKAAAGAITIRKSKNVSFDTNKGKTEYAHAELHDITRALVPEMAKHGLSHRWNVSQKPDWITVECIVSHRDGHSERVEMGGPPDQSGGKNVIQAIASTKTYLERYTFLAITGMATGGELDYDGRQPPQAKDVEYLSEEQQATLRDLIEAYVNNVGKFMDWISSQAGYRVDTLADVPADCYDRIHMQLASFRRNKLESGTDG